MENLARIINNEESLSPSRNRDYLQSTLEKSSIANNKTFDFSLQKPNDTQNKSIEDI